MAAGSLGERGKPHVVEAIRAANDARYAERRERLIAAIQANPTMSIMALSRLTGCDRETVAKYKRMHSAVEV